MTKRFSDAVQFALDLHGQQFRKSTNIPYVGHLLRVAGLTIEYHADEDTAIAAVLHDAVEDQGGIPIADKIREMFGARVRGFVMDCSDSFGKVGEKKRPWRERKEAYIEHLFKAPAESRLISSCDKLDNLRCSIACYREEGPRFWKRFNSSQDDYLWYYHTIIDVLEQTGGTPALQDLKDTHRLFLETIRKQLDQPLV